MIQTISTFIKTRHERSVNYYMKAFATYEKTGKNTFNKAAAYFGCAWMLYRKMYIHAIAALIYQYILCSYLSFIGPKIVFFVDAAIGKFLGELLSIIISCILFGTCGNALYYNVIKSRISEKYHTLNNYQPTAPALAICFAVARCFNPTLLAVVLLALYYHRDDISLNRDQSSSKQLKDTQITTGPSKQYSKKTAHNSNKTSTFLEYLIEAILFVIITLPHILKPTLLNLKSILLFIILSAPYSYLDNISSNCYRSSPEQLEAIKQYLEKTAQNSNKIPTYLAYLLTAISLAFVIFILYSLPIPVAVAAAFAIAILFPVIHA